MQLGPDGRIYGVANTSDLVVIDNVEDYANFTCHWKVSGLVPPGTTSQAGLPSFPSEWLRSLFPVAKPDRGTGYSNSETVIDVLDNDELPGACDRNSIQVEVTSKTDGATAEFDNNDKNLVYTPPPGFSGIDTVTYRITCGLNSSETNVYITVYSKPDNISDAECNVKPPTQVFSMKQAYYSEEIVTNTCTPFVGDLIDADGNPGQDGIPEVIAMADAGYGIHIFKNDLTLHKTINADFTGLGLSDPYAIADVNNDSIGEILIAQLSGDGYHLYAFTADGNQVWKSNAPFFDNTWTHSPSNYNSPNIAIADIDHDGNCEILVGDRIFAGENGQLLVTLPYAADNGRGIGLQGSHWGYFSIFGDVDGDGYMEAVGGKTTYTIRINSRTNPALNTATVLASISTRGDGFCSVGDIDGDGILDVVVTEYNGHMYAWQGSRDEQIGQLVGAGASLGSRPFIGDINGDGWADIAFTSALKMEAFRYNPGTELFEPLFNIETADNSGRTTMCMFDFDQDGKAELVYRDTDYLMILGPDGLVKKDADGNEAKYRCDSGTSSENPIVVDFDGDGHADILVTGSLVQIGEAYQGRVIVYSNNIPGTWAPARKVWNQHGYNVVNINEDLSVPPLAIDPATAFPGEDGLLGTSDDVRPYNNFLQQQTTLNSNGLPSWLTPSLQLLSTAYDYHFDGDSLVIRVTLANTGAEVTGTPLYITAYRDGVHPDSIMVVDSLMEIVPNDGVPVWKEVTVHNFSTFRPLDSVMIRLNDRGYGYEQLECDTTHLDNEIFDPESKIYALFDDVQTVQVFQYVEIDALSSDHLPPGFFNPPFSLLDSVTLPPRNGSLNVSGSGENSRFIYINSGTDSLTNQIDSFRYRFTFYHPDLGEWRTDSATVYLYILEDPHGLSACYNTPGSVVRLVERPSGVTFEWYSSLSASEPSEYSGSTRPLPAMTTDASWYIRPEVPDAPGATSGWNRAGGFPRGRFTVHVSDQTPAQMRWTGLVSHDWHDPNNWVEVHPSYETPVSWLPSPCTDVEIPGGLPRYPELRDSAACRKVILRDRAMLANPHVLKYESAEVEIRLGSLERDRYVMWSAPLKQMYSGDYHFKDVNGNPRYGDVYINLFQQDHPGGGSAKADMLTATFGEQWLALPLGRAFNLKVVSTSESRDRLWSFPQPYETQPGSLKRDSSMRLITDDLLPTGTPALFDLPVTGGSLSSSTEKYMVQVVNPYLAYLDMSSSWQIIPNWRTIT
ncbi:MAG: FG-GAP-like repeat-containing protein [Tannerella sp.]|nr:FG-GAP-like repeat-containing protein [Tannerella sp.]